jgi:hypothetical protein
MKAWEYDAVTLGDSELRLGGDLLRALAADESLPLVSANLVDRDSGRLLCAGARLVEKAGTTIGITAVTVPPAHRVEAWADVGIEARPALEALPPVLQGLRRDGARVIVLLARMPLDRAKALVEELRDVDVVVVGGTRQGRGRTLPENAGAVYVTAGNRGQALGIAEIALGADGAPEAMAADEIVLSRDVAEDPAVKAMVEDFEGNLNASMRGGTMTGSSRRSPDGHFYLGASECAKCHREEYEVWVDTPHSTAFRTLEERNKESLPECYRCHVTGNADPAGYDPGVAAARSLVNVQCEVCHGKGTAHARDGTWEGNLLMDACARCHDEENSPDFDPEVYWRMIEH